MSENEKIDLFEKSKKQAHRLNLQLNNSFGELKQYLEDKGVIEIMVNCDGQIWVEELEKGISQKGVFDATRIEQVIRLVASYKKTVCNFDFPVISAELPIDGSRFQGTLPPVTIKPTMTIRKKAILVFTLEDYVKKGIMTEPQKKAIINSVKQKQNILVAGGTGSGKTTLLNAILHEISKTDDRVIIIEDTRELQCNAKNRIFMLTKDGVKQENGNVSFDVSMTDLVKSSLRMRPDRLVVGEVRDHAVLDLLRAFNTGHPGSLATVHCNSAETALPRLGELMEGYLTTIPKNLIANAIDVIVYIERYKLTRRVKSVFFCEGIDEQGNYKIKNLADY